MEYKNVELLDLVERYKAESKIPIGNDVKLGFALFARWLLSQNLQQCNVSDSLPIAVASIRSNFEMWRKGEIKDGAFSWHLQNNLLIIEKDLAGNDRKPHVKRSKFFCHDAEWGGKERCQNECSGCKEWF